MDPALIDPLFMEPAPAPIDAFDTLLVPNPTIRPSLPDSSEMSASTRMPHATPGPSQAPARPLPQTYFYSVEYPGYVRPTSVPTAVSSLGGQHRLDRVFKRTGTGTAGPGPVGGSGSIPAGGSVGVGGGTTASGTGRTYGATSADGTLLELALRPGNPFAHPIPGDVVPANNLLLKVVKRKKKRHNGENETEPLGHYTAEVVGVMAKTVRFRSMVDYQYLPDMNDPVAKLRTAMDNMDVEALCNYRIPSQPSNYPPLPVTTSSSVSNTAGLTQVSQHNVGILMEMDSVVDMNLDPRLRAISQATAPGPDGTAQPSTLTAATEVGTGGELRGSVMTTAVASDEPSPAVGSALRLFPPPLFSRQTIPQGYNFKANTSSMLSVTIDEETGQERKRMINKMRWKGYGPASIMFADAHVPKEPPQAVQEGRHQVSETILNKLQALFLDRPVWTRMSLFSQFSAGEARDILNSKILLPLCCYVFQDGPWRDTLVRFSYDPRKDPSSRFYQRLYFRNANHPISRPSVTSRRQERLAQTQSDQLRMQEREAERRNAYIFDGKTITKETAAFQLCDITDPMLKEMIEDPDALRETCNERDGWYTTHAFERIKTVLRHKFFALLEGHVATDAECTTLLAQSEGAGGTVKTALTHRAAKLRAGKHNMAKGALRPEDAAALRLRATLDRSMKSFSSQR